MLGKSTTGDASHCMMLGSKPEDSAGKVNLNHGITVTELLITCYQRASASPKEEAILVCYLGVICSSVDRACFRGDKA